jgi:carbamoylphosphate synthase large subunit
VREVTRKRLLITGAGGGASNNLIRSLRAGDLFPCIFGCSHDRFFLRKSSADRKYLLPDATHPSFRNRLCRLVETEKIDLVIPTNDHDVLVLGRLRDETSVPVFLPRQEVIELCQDKYRLAVFLREHSLPAPATYVVTDLESIEGLFRLLPPASRLWCRIRTGTDSIGATSVKNPEQARAWISYWEEMRGVPATSFTLSEYLPGRSFSCQSLWKRGKLILVKTFEYLAFFGGKARPSGVSSVSAVAKTVFEPRVVAISEAVIRALDSDVSGVFDVNLRDHARGDTMVTEINVGRFISGTNLYDFTGRHNMAVTYVHLALDEPIAIEEPYDFASDYYMVRDFDTLPDILHADDFFDGIEDLRD